MWLSPDGWRDTPPELRNLAPAGPQVLWCGRAATALYLLFRALARRHPDRPQIIVPAVSCTTLANTALLAGLTPRFADVDPQTGLLTVETISARWTPQVVAVAGVHLYGQTLDASALQGWCSQRQTVFIEDAAQAQGAVLPDGRPVGSVGDAAVFSFNPTKILECGGGSLLINTAGLQIELDPIELPSVSAQLGLSYRNLYHALISLMRLRLVSDVCAPFSTLRSHYDTLYVQSLPDPRAVAAAWPTLAAILDARRQRADRYAQRLQGGPWHLLDDWRQSGVCWRYTLLLNDAERTWEVAERVRSSGCHVSNLYWTLPPFFKPDDACPHADRFARRVINLWVHPSVTLDDVDRCSAALIAAAR